MRYRRGFTVLELIATLLLVTLLGVVMAGAYAMAGKVWRKTGGRDAAQRELRKAAVALRQDYANTVSAATNITQCPSHLSGFDGDAILSLSPINPVTGELAQKPDGFPFMMRNVLYYLAVPAQHAQAFGYACTGASDPDGYEGACPHKILVKTLLDRPSPPANPAVPASENTLQPFGAFLTQPLGFRVAAGSEAVAVNLLTFRCQKVNQGVNVILRAAGIQEAEREIGVGTTSLTGSRFTLQVSFCVRQGI